MRSLMGDEGKDPVDHHTLRDLPHGTLAQDPDKGPKRGKCIITCGGSK